MVAALCTDRLDLWREALAGDPHALVVEHVEDLRGRPRTMDELRRCIERRLALGGPTILTLTLAPGAEDVLEWLNQCTDVILERASHS
jgi:hypothetical protein